MNILTGIYQPDAGEIIIDGYAKSFASPVEAIAAGIGMVHQHFKLVQAFTVAENIHLGWAETPRRASAPRSWRRGPRSLRATLQSRGPSRRAGQRTVRPASSSGSRFCACSPARRAS